MSEKIASAENPFKQKHSTWLATTRHEGGSLAVGTLTGYLGHKLLMLLGVTNPVFLIAGFAAAAIAGYRATHKAT